MAFLLFLLIAAAFVFYQQRSSPSSSVSPVPVADSPPTEGTSSQPEPADTAASAIHAPAAARNNRATQAPYADAAKREKIAEPEDTSAISESQPPEKQPLRLAEEPRAPAQPILDAKLSPPDLAIAPNLAGGPDLALHASIPVKLTPLAPPEFTPQRNFQGHSSWVTAVAFNANGTELASASWDRSVKLWSLPSGEESTTVTRKMGSSDSCLQSRRQMAGDGELFQHSNPVGREDWTRSPSSARQ
jgi:hypothetical protein